MSDDRIRIVDPRYVGAVRLIVDGVTYEIDIHADASVRVRPSTGNDDAIIAEAERRALIAYPCDGRPS